MTEETATYNVLVTGASGLLGRTVYRYLTDQSFQQAYPLSAQFSLKVNCLGLCNSRARPNLRIVDLNSNEQVDSLLDEFKPHAIVHCAAQKNVEFVNAHFENTLKLNKNATEHLAQACSKRGIFFIYISTDYVFDGTKPPYKVNDATNPLNKYGISKLMGEDVTRQASKKHCVVRIPILYGFTEPQKYNESAINVIYETVVKREPYAVDNVQVRFPTHTVDVARFCAQLLQKHFKTDPESEQFVGTFHCSSLEPFTKYQIALIIGDAFALTCEHIQPDLSAATNNNGPQTRPNNAQLDTTDSYAALNFAPIMDFRHSIKDCLINFV